MSNAIEQDATSAPPERDALPALFRWVLAFPGSSLWLAGAAGLLYLAGAMAVVGSDYSPVGAWDHVGYALYFAWLPFAIRALVTGTARDATELAPALGQTPVALRACAYAGGRRGLPWSLPIALAVTFADLVILLGNVPPGHDTFPTTAFLVVREGVVCIGLFWVLTWAALAAHALSKQARRHARPDLLSARPLAPLARCGTRMLLFWVLMLSLVLPVVFVSDFRLGEESMRLLLAITLALLVPAAAALMIPTWGARQAIRSAKSAELARVHEQIRAARDTRDDARLPGLLAWEARVDSASEWPIDAGSLGRAGVYVLIPLLSWVGAALVERLVDSFVG